MQQVKLSPRGQIALCLSVALVFSLVFVLTGNLASNQESAKMAAFASEGAVATGTIEKRYIHVIRSAGSVWVYWLDVKFTTADGKVHADSAQVANTVYDRYNVGDRIEVTYVKSKPEWFYLPGGAPTARDVGMSSNMSQIGVYGAALSAFGLFALFFLWRSDGGTPAGSVEDFDAPAESPLSQLASNRRSSFGTRRAGK